MQKILQITSKQLDIRIKCNMATFSIKCVAFAMLLVASLISNDKGSINLPLYILIAFTAIVTVSACQGLKIRFKKPFQKTSSTKNNVQKHVTPKEPPKPTAKDRVAEAKPAANATNTETNSSEVKTENDKSEIKPNVPASSQGKVTLLDDLTDADWDALFNYEES